MITPTTVVCHVVGGPRDGDIIVVPGGEPPYRLRVIMPPDGSRLYVWHPAAPALPDLVDADLYVLQLCRPTADHPTWRYLWPPNR